jgi:hypothetical protein
VSRWEQKVWEPPTDRSPGLVSHYDLLCRAAHVRGLHVELRLDGSVLSDLGLSNGLAVDLYGIDDLERASQQLCLRLAREVSR